MSIDRPTVAVLGTGIMGAPMARNLLSAGLPVRVWNRTAAKAAPLGADGAEVAATPREAATGADVVLTMLIDADAVEQSMVGADGALAGMRPDALWLQASTVGVAGEARLRDLARQHDVAYVDAPVLGTKQPAENGALVVLASGPRQLQERCRPVFDTIGSKASWLGPAGTGSRLKLVVNSWVLSLVSATGEAMALAEALELDPRTFLETIDGGLTDSPYAHVKGKLILDRDFPASFPVSGAAKDAGLIVRAARDAGAHLELADAIRRQMERAAELGHGEEDMAAVFYAATAGD